ncbi:MAG TPA: hypothetical protein VIP54_08590 [Microterricola sp.]
MNAGDSGGYLGAQFAAELGTVKIGAASIGFRSASDLDLDALDRMLLRARELTDF